MEEEQVTQEEPVVQTDPEPTPAPTDPKSVLIGLLETFGFPVRLQGSIAETEKYPDSFFTFWNNSSSDWSHYNNRETGWVWNFDVNFYSIDPALVNTKLDEARALLKQNGWIIDGRGYDMATDEVTHTGRGMVVLYLEKYQQEESINA